MSTYYVSGANGDDAKDGLSESNAWATVTKAVQTLVTGDKCYIAPYTYRNTSGWSLTNAGSSGSIIEYIGDPDCEQFADENPGYVRLTGCDAAELPSCAGSQFDYNNKDYVTIRNLIVDGIENGATHGVYLGTGTERIAEDCIALAGAYTFREGTQNNCIGIGGYYGFRLGSQNNCIGFGGYYGYWDGIQNNCIGIGGYFGFYLGTQNNCTGIGSYSAFRGGTGNNCMAVGCYHGFSLATANYCIALGSYYGFHNSTLTSCKALYCRFTHSGGSGAATAANHIGFTNLRMVKNLARWLKPDLFFEKDAGDDSIIPSVTEDILGQPRRMHDGTIDIGVFEYSDIEIDWTNYKATAPGIKITRKGVQEFSLPAREGKQVKVRVWVKFDVTSGSEPQLILKGEGIATQTDTATGDGSSFERLEVKDVPTKDTVLTVRLYQRDTTVSKYAIFSDLRIS